MEQQARIRVAIVDDHALLRETLKMFLEFDPRIHVCICAKHGVDMLEQLQQSELLPDIAIIDLNMPVMNGFTLTGELKKLYPRIKLLILSGYYSEYNVALTMSKGVCGYLIKDYAPAEVQNAIYSIYEDGHYFSDAMDQQAFRNFQRMNLKNISIPEREMQFLKLSCTNMQNEEIARKMRISINTLDGCRHRLFERLRINSRTELILFAMRSGIVSIDDLELPDF